MRFSSRRTMGGLVALCVAGLLAAASASGDEIPGATYKVALADGGNVTLTVSPDGSKVSSFKVDGAKADNCSAMTASLAPPEYKGAPIVDHSFSEDWYSAIVVQGTFSGAQSVSGTFKIKDSRCQTPVYSFTATTDATPPPPPPTSTDPAPPGETVTPPGQVQEPPRATLSRVRTRIAVRSRGRYLDVRVLAGKATCVGGRRLALVRGERTLHSGRAHRDGRFRFRRPTGHSDVHVIARELRNKALVCSAGRSRRL